MKSIVELWRGRVLLVAVALFAVAGGIAYASIPDASGVIHGCYRTSLDDQKGQLRVVADAGNCRNNELPIEWSVTGPAGPAGADGKDGEDGEDGEDGDPFSGTFTSPNGEYSLSVTDAGITLAGAGSTIRLAAGRVQVDSATELTLTSAGEGLNVEANRVVLNSVGLIALQSSDVVFLGAGTQLAMQSSGSASLQAVGTLRLDAAQTRIVRGAGCSPAARLGDAIVGTAAADGSVTGVVNGGSSVVCIG